MFILYFYESDVIFVVCKQKLDMEINETLTTSSDCDDVSELEKRIQCLEDELMKANAKIKSLEELLMLAENALTRCACPELKEQIFSLLSSVRYVLPKTDVADSPTVSYTRRTDAATQCKGEHLSFVSVTVCSASALYRTLRHYACVR